MITPDPFQSFYLPIINIFLAIGLYTVILILSRLLNFKDRSRLTALKAIVVIALIFLAIDLIQYWIELPLMKFWNEPVSILATIPIFKLFYKETWKKTLTLWGMFFVLYAGLSVILISIVVFWHIIGKLFAAQLWYTIFPA